VQAALIRLSAVDREMDIFRRELDRLTDQLRNVDSTLTGINAELRQGRAQALESRAALQTAEQREKLARGQLTRARSGIRLAEGRLRQVTDLLRKLMLADPALTEASDRVAAARQQYEGVREHLLDLVRRTEAYRQAAAAEADARLRLEQTQRDPLVTRADLFAASNDLLAAQSAVTELERDATADDLSYRTSRLTWMQATLMYWLRRATLSAQLYYHPDRLAAVGFVDGARAELAGLETALVAASGDRAQADAGLRAAAAGFDAAARDLKQYERERDRLLAVIRSRENRLFALQRQRNQLAGFLQSNSIRP
jgi:chromosome segregation ATPase